MQNNQPFDIRSLHGAYADGFDPETLMDTVFERIEAADSGIFLHLADRGAVSKAVAGLGPFDPASKPLWGIPFAIKDNIDAAAMPTTAACPDFAYTADADAFVVDRLRAAGAILIGKTNLDQFATGLVGLRTPYPIPKNALDPEIVPGGSSSGSAIAVSLGLVSFALGTDTAGSGRVPAALNGIVGLKPTLGALSSTGVVPACRTLDTVSVFSLMVEDAYAVFQTAACFDQSDPFARRVETEPMSALPPSFRVGVPDAATREFFGDTSQESSFAAALDDIAALGGEIVEIDFAPFYAVSALLYEGPWIAERYTVIEDLIKKHPDSIHPMTRQVIEEAERFSAADAFRGIYRLRELIRQTAPVMAAVDMICVPSIPTFYTLSDLDADPIGSNTRLGTYTNFVNLLDLCGLAVPVSNRDDDRPGSVTLLAPHGRDASIASVACALQRHSNAPLGATGWSIAAGPELRPELRADEIALAVVGAHMSGLALNHELTQLGGRFLYDAKTTPTYRLYSLPGGPPSRPGLIQDDTGSAISLEVWALPLTRFGEFIQGAPRPLSIGTLTLENSEGVKGFLCEPSGTVGAEDVTHFGGWRNYLQSL